MVEIGISGGSTIRALILGFAAVLSLAPAAPAAAGRLIEPALRIADGGSQGPQVALTLDACSGLVDHRILDELIADGIPATVFVTGRWLKGNADAFRLMLAHPELFEIEDHGENHLPAVIGTERPYGLEPAGTAEAVAKEVLNGRADIARAGGGEVTWFRGATALYSPDAIELIASLGLRIAGFSLNGDLGASVGEKAALARMLTARDGDVIIAHINQPKRPAGAGVAEGIRQLKAHGFRFVRLRDATVSGG